MTLDTQLLTMISMIIGGIYLGIATQTFRRISVVWKNWTVLTYFLEISYWIFQTCLLFFILYHVKNGELRIYIFLACLLGFSMYQVLLKSTYQRILEWIIKIVVMVINGIIKVIDTIIVRPIRWIIMVLVRTIQYVLTICYRILKFIGKVLFYPIKLLISFIQKRIPKKTWNKINKSLTICSTIRYKFKKRLKNIFGNKKA